MPNVSNIVKSIQDIMRKGAGTYGDAQRVREIGLLKALGAPASQIRNLFFAEAILLSGIGSVAGLVLGEIGTRAIAQAYPALPVAAPWWAVLAAFGTALGTGILFSVWPARRAARLDPVMALARS